MPRFFIDKENAPPGDYSPGDCIRLIGEDASHIIRSLRMKVGEKLVLCNGQGTDYKTVISSINESDCSLSAQIDSVEPSTGEPPCKITVYQGIVKGDKMDTVIQKSVELGAYEIVPVRTENSIAKLDDDGARKKVARWQKIASEAAKQCGRGKLPTVRMPQSFTEMLDNMKKDDLSFACFEAEKKCSVKELLSGSFDSVSFFIGPEGGISPKECEKLIGSDIPLVTLGNRILRTETAAAAVLSMLLYEKEL